MKTVLAKIWIGNIQYEYPAHVDPDRNKPPPRFKPWRTRQEAWAGVVKRIEALPIGPMRKAALIDEALGGLRDNAPPWCWEEFLDDDRYAPIAKTEDIEKAREEIYKEHNGPVGEPIWWPELKEKLTAWGLGIRGIRKKSRDLFEKVEPGPRR